MLLAIGIVWLVSMVALCTMAWRAMSSGSREQGEPR